MQSVLFFRNSKVWSAQASVRHAVCTRENDDMRRLHGARCTVGSNVTFALAHTVAIFRLDCFHMQERWGCSIVASSKLRLTFSRCRRQENINRNHPALDSEGVTQPRSLEPYGRTSGYRKHGSSTRHSHTLFPALCNVQPSHSVSKEHPASQPRRYISPAYAVFKFEK
jgi:hypothetical protein